MSPRRTTERPVPMSSAPAPGAPGEPGERVTRGLDVDASDPGHALVQRFRLLVTAGPDAGRSFVSTGERSVVGTHESADFRLEDYLERCLALSSQPSVPSESAPASHRAPSMQDLADPTRPLKIA